MSDTPTRPRLAWAALGAAALLAVAAAALLASRGKSWGTIRACVKCGQPGQPLAEGWVEVPEGDAWALELEPGLAAVVRGPSRFEVTGPRPGRWMLALSRGTLFAQAGGAGQVSLMLQRNEASRVEGAVVSTSGPARFEVQATSEGNAIRAGAGQLVLQVRAGEQHLKAGEAWQSPAANPAPPSPTAQEQGWLDQYAPMAK